MATSKNIVPSRKPPPAKGRVAPNPEMDSLKRQNQGLSTLLQLQRELLQGDTADALIFIVVNDSHRLVPYRQAIYWEPKSRRKARIKAASGVSQIDSNAPFSIWMQQVCSGQLKRGDAKLARVVGKDDVHTRLHEGWEQWSAGHVLWLPLVDQSSDTLLGGLWMDRNVPWQESEITILKLLAEVQAHALASLHCRKRSFAHRLRAILPKSIWRVLLLLIITACMWIPIHQSVLAPAEVVPLDPVVVTSPLDGVVKTFFIKPHEAVRKDQPLFSLDDTAIRNRHEVAKKSLAVVKAEHLQAAQKAFWDTESKADLALLEAQITTKKAEVEYTRELLDRVIIRAERDGMAVFNDINDWIGKPVALGEKVMTLADPEHSELQIWIPVSDAINLDAGAKTLFFLNVDPTKPLSASLYRASFEAQKTPEDILAYQGKATFSDDLLVQPRVGLKGTAKIFGREVYLYYYLSRRPLAAARQFLGL
ncbi:MAG: HlyD family efflux transporter periplasmic adaptor subunit [Magnetococcales bacterium]|nr:HlyD family efflux transporter periplasmic adaptor subunit [Magnetococcales bacterium]